MKWGKVMIAILESTVCYYALHIHLFLPHNVSLDDLRGEVKVYEDAKGNLVCEYPLSYVYGTGGAHIIPFLRDYEMGVTYTYHIVTVKTTRWDLLFSRGRDTRILWKAEKLVKPEPPEDITYYLGREHEMTTLPIRVYYENSDFTYVMLWESSDVAEVTERCNYELGDPWGYANVTYKKTVWHRRVDDIKRFFGL